MIISKLLILVLVCSLGLSPNVQALDTAATSANLEERVERLENDMQNALNDIGDVGGNGLVFFLFGVVCALWAQNTGRNPWLWFFLGVFLSVVAALILLNKNSRDLRERDMGYYASADGIA